MLLGDCFDMYKTNQSGDHPGAWKVPGSSDSDYLQFGVIVGGFPTKHHGKLRGPRQNIYCAYMNLDRSGVFFKYIQLEGMV